MGRFQSIYSLDATVCCLSCFSLCFFFVAGFALFFIVYSLTFRTLCIKRFNKRERAIKLYIKATSWQFLSHKVDANASRSSHSVNNFAALHMVVNLGSFYIILIIIMQNKSLQFMVWYGLQNMWAKLTAHLPVVHCLHVLKCLFFCDHCWLQSLVFWASCVASCSWAVNKNVACTSAFVYLVQKKFIKLPRLSKIFTKSFIQRERAMFISNYFASNLINVLLCCLSQHVSGRCLYPSLSFLSIFPFYSICCSASTLVLLAVTRQPFQVVQLITISNFPRLVRILEHTFWGRTQPLQIIRATKNTWRIRHSSV